MRRRSVSYFPLTLAAALPALASCTVAPRDMEHGFDSGTPGSELPAQADNEDGEMDEVESATDATAEDAQPEAPSQPEPVDEPSDSEFEDSDPYVVAEVFGHSGSTLFRLDPGTLEVETVADFSGCEGSVIDIALDEDSTMFGVTYEALYEIDRATAQCTLIAEGEYPTSLSFVPAGTVDSDVEALVGFSGAEYIRIDTQTGRRNTLGTLSDGLESSGDVVSVKDGGTYLTVFGPGCMEQDCIIEFDPTNGRVLENFGPIPYADVFGLAFWAGNAYGFARSGEVFEVEFTHTGGVLTRRIPIPGSPSNLEFFGAGSTTSAPVIAG